MGASESSLISSTRQVDEITTISQRTQTKDPLIEKLESIQITTPIVTSGSGEGSLADILVKKRSSSSSSSVVNPNVLLELFSVYRDWQQQKTREIAKKQEDIENKIEVADALSVKLLQRFNYSVSATRATSQHLSEVHGLQVEVGELKGRLTEVISNCDALCNRIAKEGPESLQSSIKPFARNSTDVESTLASQNIIDKEQEAGESSSF
ncbi:hypothetical protein Leryth_012969 [Lithospermum erythrorhizon]|nr:hypothetical protein Leryth_012969 [Lithospermum erythrorhizon]